MTERLEHSEESPRVRAKLWSTLAEVHHVRTRLDEAEAATLRGMAAAEEAQAEPELLHLRHQRAVIVQFRDGAAAAEPLLRESVRQHERYYGVSGAELAPVLQDWTSTLTDRDAAARVLDRVLQIALQHPEDRIAIAAAYNQIGANHWGARRAREAREAFERAYDTLIQVVAEDNADLLSIRSNLAQCDARTGRFAEAERGQRAILTSRRRIFGERSYWAGASWMNLGVTLAHQGRFQEAVEALENAVATTSLTIGADHAEVLAMQSDLASALVRGGRPEEGFALYDRLINHLQAQAVPESTRVMQLQLARTRGRLHLGLPTSIAQGAPSDPAGQRDGQPRPPGQRARNRGLIALTSPDSGNAAEARAALREAIELRRSTQFAEHPSAPFLSVAESVARAAGVPIDRDSLAASLRQCERWGMAHPGTLRRARRLLAD
ncbi:MAG: tetratricopeptide repeat protein [Candidatus Eisenbacteria bacterium]|nr:tetratricopeptide repeat protein [Candidatus Eisenbacteria bacterium]